MQRGNFSFSVLIGLLFPTVVLAGPGNDLISQNLHMDLYRSNLLPSSYDPCPTLSSNGKFYYCRDGSVSYIQPSNTQYEGLCGQTTAANLIYMYCGRVLEDVDALGSEISDLTPGTMAKTLQTGLSRKFAGYNAWAKKNGKAPLCSTQGKWSRYFYDNDGEFLWSVASGLTQAKILHRTRLNGSKVWRAPVAAVITANGDPLQAHWVTVVDVENFADAARCSVTFNESGTQWKLPCGKFRELAKFSVGVWGLGSEVRVKFERN